MAVSGRRRGGFEAVSYPVSVRLRVRLTVSVGIVVVLVRLVYSVSEL